MIKKVFATLALVASASFAQWDHYPVPQDLNGSVRVHSDMRLFVELTGSPSNESHSSNYGIDFRYIFLNSLELSISGLGFSLYRDGGLLALDSKFETSFIEPMVGIRYQALPMLSVYANVGLPLAHPSSISDEWYTSIGAQFGKVYDNPDVLSKFGVIAETFITPGVLELAASGEVGFNIINNGLNLLLGADIVKVFDTDKYDKVNHPVLAAHAWLGFETNFSKTFSIAGKFTATASKLKDENAYTGRVNLSAQYNF